MTEEIKVSPERLRAFAKYIEQDQDVFKEIIIRTHLKLFDEFANEECTFERRVEIGHIINASTLFQKEINVILAEAQTNING